MPDTRFIVSDLLEQNANQQDREKGLDLADFLIRQDWRLFRNPQKTEPSRQVETPKPIEPFADKSNIAFRETMPQIESNKTELWDLKPLEDFFASIQLSQEPIQLSRGMTILNAEKYVQSHMAAIKANNGNRWFEPYLDRLITFKNLIEDGRLKTD
jgi:hypothetical protein